MIKNIIQAVLSTGLIPVTTICDQATLNQAGINCLMQNTRQQYIKKNEEYAKFVFEINGMKIVPLYDYPHFIKCIWNHFLTKDIWFETAGKKRRASWKHAIHAWNGHRKNWIKSLSKTERLPCLSRKKSEILYASSLDMPPFEAAYIRDNYVF